MSEGTLQLKIGNKSLSAKFGGHFPQTGSLIPNDYVSATAIQDALMELGVKHLSSDLHMPIASLFARTPPVAILQNAGETITEAAIRITRSMSCGCLVVQGPPGTGKTDTAAHVINALMSAGMKIGVASNSHKAVVNLLIACGSAVKDDGGTLRGIKVGGDGEGPLFSDNPGFRYSCNGRESSVRVLPWE